MIDTARLNRIRWRARRGLLENDIILEKFFNRYGDSLTESMVAGLDPLLDLSDNDLLDLVIGRAALDSEKIAPQVALDIRTHSQHVLTLLQQL